MVGRNAPCPCGSGKNYKKCCLDRDREAFSQAEAEGREAVAWRDPATGVELTLRAPNGVERVGPVFLSDLSPGCAEGPGADPEAVFAALEAAWQDPDAFYEQEATIVPRFEHHPTPAWAEPRRSRRSSASASRTAAGASGKALRESRPRRSGDLL